MNPMRIIALLSIFFSSHLYSSENTYPYLFNKNQVASVDISNETIISTNLDENSSQKRSNIKKFNLELRFNLIHNIYVAIDGAFPASYLAKIQSEPPKKARYLKIHKHLSSPQIQSSLNFDLGTIGMLTVGTLYTATGHGSINANVIDDKIQTDMNITIRPINIPFFSYLVSNKSFLFGIKYIEKTSPAFNIQANATIDLSIAAIPIETDSIYHPFFSPRNLGIVMGIKSDNQHFVAYIDRLMWNEYQDNSIIVEGKNNYFPISSEIEKNQLKPSHTINFQYKKESIHQFGLNQLSLSIGWIESTPIKLIDQKSLIDTHQYLTALGLYFTHENFPNSKIYYKLSTKYLEPRIVKLGSRTQSRIKGYGYGLLVGIEKYI